MQSNLGLDPAFRFLGDPVRVFHGTVAPTLDAEMLAFDELGPRTRDALARAVTRFSAKEILTVIQAGGHDCRFVPIDMAMAKIIDFADAVVLKGMANVRT